jgi:hypothetical protein
MKTFRFAFRAIAIVMAATPTLGLSAPVFAADNGQTPGPAEPAGGKSREVSPYVPPADVYVPESSKVVPADAGKRTHTNILIRKPSESQPKGLSDLSQPEPAANPAPHNVRKKKHKRNSDR